ncbi:hypothetical protein C7405_112131 [Paraburkholderia caballeronis]|uniref:hypothetical protein n=1 Tax=Paraburkholderia caballeronis TaxID=416943 RepID=UPI0010658AA5|nr:hypothetical protein [Paraburkholderia caballeronis]TDV32819.1 hypothetical protein C7405_112131 [Paraburkholderia caballeronis]
MKPFLASTLALASVIALAGTAAKADTPGGAPSDPPCSIGYVTGVGGAVQSLREYLATPDRDRYRYLADNEFQCRISDEGRASGCTGVTSLRREKVSVYDEIDSTTMAVVARIELERGTYPVIIAVSKQDLRCDD